eukprot:g2812.t1
MKPDQRARERERADTARRVAILGAHLSTSVSSSPSAVTASSAASLPMPALQDKRKWTGWGFTDTKLELREDGQVALSGARYPHIFPSHRVVPKFRAWIEEKVGLDVRNTSPPPHTSVPSLPPVIEHHEFVEAIRAHCDEMSTSEIARFSHAHGQTAQEVFQLRWGTFERVPDLVVWPGKHEHVEAIVAAAREHNVCIIPYGGGTSVSEGLRCPADEARMIVSLDMAHMARIKWIDRESMLACVEAGAVGATLSEELSLRGLCLGHEPDSIEFSTVGGWVATRASGMKKNAYGNIEDVVVNVRMVTPAGTLMKGASTPRSSTGPDTNHIALGSEGTLGVVTEVIFKIVPRPVVQEYDSIVFPDFEHGVACLRHIARERVAPASIRLVDNMQFQFGQALKPQSATPIRSTIIDAAKKFYVTRLKRFDPEQLVAATMVFEGDKETVEQQKRRIAQIYPQYAGLGGGSENGMRGYYLTYMIAYMRDFAFEFNFMAESFETSVAWDTALPLCNSVKVRIRSAAMARGVPGTPFVSCRISQVYDTGVCIYFYFGFLFGGLDNPVATFDEIYAEARDEIMSHGGSLSHHHGVGKSRKKWMPAAVSPAGLAAIRGLKESLDPTNVFAVGNLI